jgi:hypothetical protein
MIGCTEKVIGGFQELVDVSTLDNPGGTIPGLTIYWCAGDEDSLLAATVGKHGRFIVPETEP